MGDVLIDVPKPWNDPMANNPLTTLNLLEHDDSHVGVQLVKAQTVIGSGGSLTLRDLQGDAVEADKSYTLHKTEQWSPKVIMDSASRPHR